MKIRIGVCVLACLALGAPAFAGILFSDGAVNGTLDGYYIDGPGGSWGQTISDEFVATNSGTAASFDFGEWVTTGETPTSVTWSLGTSAFASDIAGSSADVSFTFFSHTGIGTTYDIYVSHVDGLSGFLTAGDTYYLTLGGAEDSGAGPAAWDTSDGPATCFFATAGVEGGECGLGGEAFTIYDSNGAAPEPGSLVLFGSGLLGLAAVLRRKIRR